MTIQSLSQLVMMMLVMARMLRLFVSSVQTATTMCRYRPFILKEENLNFQSPHGDTLKEKNLNFHNDTSFFKCIYVGVCPEYAKFYRPYSRKYWVFL